MGIWARLKKRPQEKFEPLETTHTGEPEDFQSAATHPERYYPSATAKYSLNDDSYLAYSFYYRRAEVLPAHEIELLDYCESLKTIDQHAEACADAIGLSTDGRDAAQIVEVKDQLSALVAAGFLVSENALMEMCQRTASESKLPPKIASLGVVTCNRIDSLERCLTSYMQNCRTFGRTNDFVVMDDSQSAETRGAARHMLRELKKNFNVDISYAGLEEKMSFAQELIAAGDLPPEAVNFALFDETGIGFSGGKNRNALFLQTAGDMIFSTDDDAVCRLAAAPEYRDEDAFGDEEQGGMKWWFFPDRETALESTEFVEEDVLGIHEVLLGKDLSTCITTFGEIELLDFQQLDPQSFSFLRSGGGRVLVTFTGLIGDSGAPRPAILRSLDPDSSQRLEELQSDHLAALRSREILRLVVRPRVGRKTYINSTALAYDNREVLPPFVPVLRGEDSIFGSTLNACFDDALYGDLPRAILHAPMETRSYSSNALQESALGVWPSGIMLACISSKSFWPGMRDGPERLCLLGQHLIEIGCMPLPDFEEFVRIRVLQMISDHIQTVEAQLEYYGASGDWADEVHDYVENLRAALLRPEYVVPVDLRQGRSLDEARRLSQHLVLRFGQLLDVWPEMVETAKSLRARGHRLTTTI